MKVERSTRHAEYMYRIAEQINARVDELVATGMDRVAASRQANDEIVRPEIKRRAQARQARSQQVKS